MDLMMLTMGGMLIIVVPKNNDYNDVHCWSWMRQEINGDYYGYNSGVSTTILSATLKLWNKRSCWRKYSRWNLDAMHKRFIVKQL